MPAYINRGKGFGKRLRGRTLFYRGYPKKPNFLKAKGEGFSGCKHLFETLDSKFKKYKLILHPTRDEIRWINRRLEVFISEKTIRKYNKLMIESGRELKLDAMNLVLSSSFPKHFQKDGRAE